MKLQIINTRNNKVIGSNIILGNTLLLRLIGLIGKKELKEDEGILLTPCNSIHMMFMKIPLDIIFLDSENKIIKVIENIKPWKISPIVLKAKSVLELPINSIKKNDLQINDKLDIIKINDK
ncbi:MAG: hypothetical protein KatS3mg068_0851 [Candidatus Sericytochromatia bacterium]|nr:MAG: hypothetical protein KatS3mg068_0851 [Candidatus Sericytochromatia bacterium]